MNMVVSINPFDNGNSYMRIAVSDYKLPLIACLALPCLSAIMLALCGCFLVGYYCKHF